MTIEQMLRDPRLLGGLGRFQDLTSWRVWLAFLKATYGLAMIPDDLELFRKHTGRLTPKAAGYPEAVVVTGVQSGKTTIAAAIVAHAAVVAGTRGQWALLLGQDHNNSRRVMLEAVREPFEQVEAFRSELVDPTAETLRLRNGVTVAAYPCRPASLRGLRACVVVLDEFAFYTTSEGRRVDTEMLRAARGRVAMTGGKIVIISSPYHDVGELADLRRKHYGREDSDVLVWCATAPEMNPRLPADYLRRLEQNDPEAYRSEVLGEFRTGVATLFDPDALIACVDAGIRERQPSHEHTYVSFQDAASGSGKDSYAMAVAHRDGERIVLDVVRLWKPPFNPSGVIAEASDLLKRYGLRETTGDRYAPGFVQEQFRANGVTYLPSETTTSDNYLTLLPAVNAGGVLLPDQPELLRQLRGLERRLGNAGRDKVVHRPGDHDDAAAACAGVVAGLQRNTHASKGGAVVRVKGL